MESTEQWATQHFGRAQLGDTRRTRTAVALAAVLAQHPDASLPTACGSWATLKQAYRLLNQPEVTRTALSSPHWAQTRQAATLPGVTLLIQDLTELDYSAHPAVSGLGAIGDGNGRGVHVHTTLAYQPASDHVVGVAFQQTSTRTIQSPLTRAQRRRRNLVESVVWPQAVTHLGTPPAGAQWIHVGDRGADMWPVFAACRTQQVDCVIRVRHRHRIVALTPDEAWSVAEVADQLPVFGEQTVQIAQRGGRAARTAQVRISAGPVQMPAPRDTPQATPMPLWLVLVQEIDPPPGEEALDWWLWTTVPTPTLAAAEQVIAWYRLRWLVEDYHQCLKTGCRIEHRQFQTAEALERLLGVLGPVAAYLLALRHAARQTPEALATTQHAAPLVQVVARLAGQAAATLTCRQFWETVARRGGWLGRAGDGPPGWKSLWAGWQALLLLLEGWSLAGNPP